MELLTRGGIIKEAEHSLNMNGVAWRYIQHILGIADIMKREASMPSRDHRIYGEGVGVLQEPGPGDLHGEVGKRRGAQATVHNLLKDFARNASGQLHLLGVADQLLVLLAGFLILGRVHHPDLHLQDGVLEVNTGIGTEARKGFVDGVQILLSGIHGRSTRDFTAGVEVSHQGFTKQDDNTADGNQTQIIIVLGVGNTTLLQVVSNKLNEFYASNTDCATYRHYQHHHSS